MSEFYVVYINGEEVAGELRLSRAEDIAWDEIQQYRGVESAEVHSPAGEILLRLVSRGKMIHDETPSEPEAPYTPEEQEIREEIARLEAGYIE